VPPNWVFKEKETAVCTHHPVLLEEAMELLNIKPDGIYVDGSLGGGGHAEEILSRLGPDGLFIGIDKDPQALSLSRERLLPYASRTHLVQASFSDLQNILKDLMIREVQGILLDLGVSSLQLSPASGRGFSFQSDEPLDMRMDPQSPITAGDMINRFPYGELKKILKIYGEEREAARIARALVKAREKRPVQSTGELVHIILEALPLKGQKVLIHPATRTFQALRIAVNQEMETLSLFLKDQWEALGRGGRLVMISFHSLEDRMVKNRFRELSAACRCPPGFPRCQCGVTARLKILTKKPIRPGQAEIAGNPRSRSAKLRAAEKL